MDVPKRNGCLATAAKTPIGLKMLSGKGRQPCAPGRRSRNKPGQVRQAPLPASQLHRDHIFGRLQDWHRVAARDDRCATAFFSAAPPRRSHRPLLVVINESDPNASTYTATSCRSYIGSNTPPIALPCRACCSTDPPNKVGLYERRATNIENRVDRRC